MEILKIKGLIKKSGLTYEEFGDMVGLSKISIGRIVRGEQTPSFGKLKEMADVLGVGVADFFNDSKLNPDYLNKIEQAITILKDIKK